MLKTLYTTILAAFVGLLAGPLWGQDIQKVLLHAHDNKTAIELTFLSGNRFEMQITESQSGIHGDPKASTEVWRGSAKRVTDRMELSVDGRSIGYVQIQAQLYWGGRQDPRAFDGAAFR